MTSLQLDTSPSPWGSPYWKKLPSEELARYDLQAPTDKYFIDNLELLVDNMETALYKGSLKLPDSPDLVKGVVKTDFFAKALRTSAFIHEADMYELHLSTLQGLSIPYCYGLFHHKDKDDKVSSFLVLEECGDLIDDVSSLTNSFKLKALDALYKIHCAGYIHGDFSLNNLTVKDGQPFFIDLETAEPHKCEVTERIVVGEERRAIECDEIDLCCMMLEICADCTKLSIPVYDIQLTTVSSPAKVKVEGLWSFRERTFGERT
ncbi:hypothetical protein PC9H_000453 [Pleurotus ostreatus]|uniref:Uncharacterized protein n=1 Tax=Pleurotus ostreatus TaxID=5322 RepID=A0A8H7A3K5_PLEOS|nr:uncharacterized protein PC9H_000453 [Pleurotus ostreatus]KAF7440109.1 hypothetical protein PC9H_000453 [Pleurotus ostreatus]KAJ8700632.1 hypothetical protein PTI98_003641 [Pleurotus ostreatus]